MPANITIARTGLTVELLLFRAYGRAGNTGAMLDKALALNPGLAGLGVELPLGTRLTLPDLTAPASAASGAISLFGD